MDWSQLRTIIWLRWRLTRNQWSRSGQLNAVLTMIVVAVCIAIGVGGGLAGVLAGLFSLAKAPPRTMLVVWDMIIGALMFFWMIGIVSEIQRSETVDISRMLHLPISLRDIFLVNYLASHLTISIILFLPAMLGLSLGLMMAGRWSMILMFPLVLGVVFMITAWTYCLRGWLAALMVNKRRRRTVIAVVTFSFVVLVQLPNIISNLARDRKRHRPNTVKSAPLEEQAIKPPISRSRRPIPHAVLVAHKAVPFLWVGNGAMSLAKGNALPAVLSAAGAFCIGGLGLRRAYRSTIRFYQGHTVGRRPKHKTKAKKAHALRRNFLEKQLPGIPDEAAALALAFFRSLSRAPEVKMALATSFIMLLLFGAMFFARGISGLSDNFKPLIATAVVVVYTFLGMCNLMFNLFGFDRGGFRQLVLLPVPRRQILLGKNLAFLPFAIGFGLTSLVLVKIILRISFTIVLAAGLQLVAAFVLLSIAGNLISVLVPYRITPGSMKRTKTSTMTSFLIFISRLFFPVAMVPMLLPPAMGLLVSYLGWLPAGLVNLLFSILLLVLLVFFYWLSLPGLGNMLLKREIQILQVVTAEVE
jgi:ABC-2 type transport system permease protein